MGKFVNWTGRRVGALTVIDRGPNDASGKPRWNCRCDCGNLAIVRSHFLYSAQATSCGCGVHRSAKRANDLTGQRFGSLIALHRGLAPKPGKPVPWHCICDCGNKTVVASTTLRNGHTRSCGCAKKQHGHSGGIKKHKTGTYSSWKCMIARCTYPSNPSYAHYKKRGITVCERWHNFENFLADMGERPGGKREYTLDREDNNGNYEPGNCRWVDKKNQANNRITNIHFTYKGNRYTLAELARETGVAKETLRCRLVRPGGWSVESAVETPVMSRQERGRRGGSARSAYQTSAAPTVPAPARPPPAGTRPA